MEFNLNEIFYSVQGEGPYTGVPMMFVRFAGCNLSCTFCDTNYSTIDKVDSEFILEYLAQAYLKYNTWHVCLTGGEPTNQNIGQLVRDLFFKGFKVHLETNGINGVEESKYYTNISFSPKTKDFKIKSAQTLKLLFPYVNECTPELFKDFPCTYRYIQPINHDNYSGIGDNQVISEALQEITSNPNYRLSIQIHKSIGVQ